MHFGMPSYTASFARGGETLGRIDGVNQPLGQNQIALYTSVAGSMNVAADSIMAVIRLSEGRWRPNGKVTGVVEHLMGDSTSFKVAEGRAYLAGRGNRAAIIATMRPGQEIEFTLETNGFDWEQIEHAVGGGPFLIQSGQIVVDAESQGFNAAFTNGRHPRTAVGRTESGDLWLVAIDGRQRQSIGATLPETADIMRQLGCVDAINLDGGGSTAIHLLGLTVNRPSDRTERAVSNGILLFGPRQEPTEGTLKIEAPSTLYVGETLQVRVTHDGNPVPHEEVLWGAQGAGWIDQAGTLRTLEPGTATIVAHVRGHVMTVPLTVSDRPTPSRAGTRGGRGGR
jgi:hypothetical protein